MYGLNAFAFVLFVGINVLAHRLCTCPQKGRRTALRLFCIALLAGNILRYGVVYPLLLGQVRIPAEFSTVAYFGVPAALLLGRERSRSWAAYSGLMAGFFYYMAVILAGGPVYGTYPPYDVYLSMFCHGTLYLCGLVTVGTQPCFGADRYKLLAGVSYVAVRAVVLRPYVLGAETMFIYKLLDGQLVKWLLPQVSWAAVRPAYYAEAAALLLLSVKVFFRWSGRRYKRFSSRCRQQSAS